MLTKSTNADQHMDSADVPQDESQEQKDDETEKNENASGDKASLNEFAVAKTDVDNRTETSLGQECNISDSVNVKDNTDSSVREFSNDDTIKETSFYNKDETEIPQRQSVVSFDLDDVDYNINRSGSSVSFGLDAKDNELGIQGPPDGGWGWVVTASCFMVLLVVDGQANSFGVLYTELLDAFKKSKSETAWIGSTQAGVTYLTGLISGGLIVKFGCRKVALAGCVIGAAGLGLSSLANDVIVLYFTYGILGGFGFGLMFFGSIISVEKYFNKKQSIAIGISFCGSGTGTVAFSLLQQIMLDHFSWKETLWMLSGSTAACVLFIATFKPPAHERTHMVRHPSNTELGVPRLNSIAANLDKTIEMSREKPSASSKAKDTCKVIFDISLFKIPTFVFVFCSTMGLSIGSQIVYKFLPDHAKTMNFVVEFGTLKAGATLLIIIGIASILGRLVAGVVARYLNKVYLLIVFLIVTSTSVLIFPACKSFTILAIATGVFGFASGGVSVLIPSVLRHLLGLDLMAKAFGLSNVAYGITALLAPPFSGWLYEITSNYQTTFFIAGSTFLASAAFIALIPILHRYQKRRFKFGKAKPDGPLNYN